MREEIGVLTSLQEVDREITEKKRIKQLLLAEIQKREGELAQHRAEVGELKAEWTGKDTSRREKERTLQDEGRKAADKRMRMNRVKNIKELQALQREIEQIKQANTQTEEELIGLMEGLEASASVVKEKEEALRQLEEEHARRQEEIQRQIAELEQAAEQASQTRGALAGQLNRDLIQRYELIFSRRGGTAVVAVADGICQGCYMNIPPQLWNEIIKSDRLNLCPSCHRILYHKPAAPNDKQI